MRRSTDTALQTQVQEEAMRQLTHDERQCFRIVLLRSWLEQDDGRNAEERERHEADLHRTEQLVGLLAAHEL